MLSILLYVLLYVLLYELLYVFKNCKIQITYAETGLENEINYHEISILYKYSNCIVFSMFIQFVYHLLYRV